MHVVLMRSIQAQVSPSTLMGCFLATELSIDKYAVRRRLPHKSLMAYCLWRRCMLELSNSGSCSRSGLTQAKRLAEQLLHCVATKLYSLWCTASTSREYDSPHVNPELSQMQGLTRAGSIDIFLDISWSIPARQPGHRDFINNCTGHNAMNGHTCLQEYGSECAQGQLCNRTDHARKHTANCIMLALLSKLLLRHRCL